MSSPYNKQHKFTFNDLHDLKDILNNLADNCFIPKAENFRYEIKIEANNNSNDKYKNEVQVTYTKIQHPKQKTWDEHFREYIKDKGPDFYVI